MAEHRSLIAAMIAPWAAPAVLILLPVVQSRSWPFHYELPLIVTCSIVFSYLGSFALGLPLVHVLRRVGWLSLTSLTLSGALAGALVFYVFFQLLGVVLASSAPFGTLQILWGVSLGFSVALVFGVIAGITWRSSGRPKADAA